MKTNFARCLAFSFLLAVVPFAKAHAQSDSKSGFPSCTDSLSSVALPSAPHGLFAIIFPNVRLQEKPNTSC